MHKNLSRIILFHLFIILYWIFLYKIGSITKEVPILNGVCILLIMTLCSLIYIGVSNKNVSVNINILFMFISLSPLAVVMGDFIQYKILLGMISLLSTFIYMRKFIVYKNHKYINILMILKQIIYILATSLIVGILIIQLFDAEPFMSIFFYNLIFLTMEISLVLFLKGKEGAYKKIYKLYYLSDYIANERDEFVRIIHDDIIQDIFAIKNYLSLKNSDIEYAKKYLNKA